MTPKRPRRLLAAFTSALAISACGAGSDDPPPPRGPQNAPEPVASAPAPPPWTFQASGTAGAAIVHADESGREVLRLACRRQPSSLYAALPGFTRIGSEDRLTIGAGDELAVFVVSMEGPKDGLDASGQPNPAFMAALAAGRPIGVSYGARQMTLPPPAPDVRAAFAAACTG